MIITAEISFWQRVVQRRPPPPINLADAVRQFNKSMVKGRVTATLKDCEYVDSLRKIEAEAERLKKEGDDLKGRIITAIGNNGDTLVDIAGQRLATFKQTKARASFDLERFIQDHPDLYAQYLKESQEPSRRFSLAKGE
jgi:predicted phage-related endonuclease